VEVGLVGGGGRPHRHTRRAAGVEDEAQIVERLRAGGDVARHPAEVLVAGLGAGGANNRRAGSRRDVGHQNTAFPMASASWTTRLDDRSRNSWVPAHSGWERAKRRVSDRV